MAFSLSTQRAVGAVSRAATGVFPVPAVVRAGVRCSVKARRSLVVSNVAAPTQEKWNVTVHGPSTSERTDLPQLISREQVESLEVRLGARRAQGGGRGGAGGRWGGRVKTHRELFSDFFASLFGYELQQLIADSPQPPAAQLLFAQMSRDILNGGTKYASTLEQASYALGYNLAIEYLADYEKTWMLDSFRQLEPSIFAPLGRKVDWVFLEVHAEGEAEHAAIGHNAVLNLVPSAHLPILRAAMADHDRDFAAFYNHVADLLEAKQ
ncbi:hypothetical protein TSOC_012698 [Tetrabaena socialis]|uniref:Uncharacterized protein n=1 Tax=Tetrabaena socialis TaxID=47790 RepID=A0A2J7ZMD2_9CHLO|nr:hypothetical protein TSOC_012698 [Tetrabaena socialis]|eukprot:PNH01422.1 hypothetical protein TSOC_012698 [Tetrabaena socialis]